ncbi:MAG: hypothetical protein RSE46_25305, partial [Janthinobacterium sp.]
TGKTRVVGADGTPPASPLPSRHPAGRHFSFQNNNTRFPSCTSPASTRYKNKTIFTLKFL